LPLDKIEEVENYIPTHESLILHIKNNPVGCILEKNNDNKLKFKTCENITAIKASLRGFLNKHEELGLIMGCKLKIQMNTEILEYTTYPTEEFIDSIIFNETIFLIDQKMNKIFSCKILTNQFVKTKSEFNKFKKLLDK
tara:strand:- start:352 stop:768 length:417 start_codon:yes stop_codon:yes gene_type:complete